MAPRRSRMAGILEVRGLWVTSKMRETRVCLLYQALLSIQVRATALALGASARSTRMFPSNRHFTAVRRSSVAGTEEATCHAKLADAHRLREVFHIRRAAHSLTRRRAHHPFLRPRTPPRRDPPRPRSAPPRLAGCRCHTRKLEQDEAAGARDLAEVVSSLCQ